MKRYQYYKERYGTLAIKNCNIVSACQREKVIMKYARHVPLLVAVALFLGCSRPAVERPSKLAPMPTEPGRFSKMPDLR
jgi:hypothetical protein